MAVEQFESSSTDDFTLTDVETLSPTLRELIAESLAEGDAFYEDPAAFRKDILEGTEAGNQAILRAINTGMLDDKQIFL